MSLFQSKTSAWNLPNLLLIPYNFLASLNFKCACLHIPISSVHQKFLCFAVGSLLYQFVDLHFSLLSPPWVFTKVLVPILALLLSGGIDDLLLREHLELVERPPRHYSHLDGSRTFRIFFFFILSNPGAIRLCLNFCIRASGLMVAFFFFLKQSHLSPFILWSSTIKVLLSWDKMMHSLDG